jgi:two-component sensor histidine kinase
MHGQGYDLGGRWKRLLDPRFELGWPGSIILCIICVVIATAARIALGALFGPTLPFATYFPAVLIAALFGGVTIGLLSIPLSVVAVWWAIDAPVYEFSPITPVELANFSLFSLSSLVVVWLALRYRRLLEHLAQQEQERKLLVGELEHRGKNVIAVVIALIRQTVKDKQTSETLINRVMAVTSTQGIVDEAGATDLHALLEEVLFVCRDRVKLEGPKVELNESTTRAMRLIFHEMLTNAIKHGALADERGRITVDWSLGDFLTIDWCELDGPKVTPPVKYNFGSRLITRMLTQLDAEFEPRFPETGYCYKMKIPVAGTIGGN